MISCRGIRSEGTLRPPLKSLFPEERPGGNISADWKLFFQFSRKKKSPKNVSTFLTTKKNRKKKEFAPP